MRDRSSAVSHYKALACLRKLKLNRRSSLSQIDRCVILDFAIYRWQVIDN